MVISQQIWSCIIGGRERVYGLGAAEDEKDKPLLYCAEHGRLCRHTYVRNNDATYVEHRQGERA